MNIFGGDSTQVVKTRSGTTAQREALDASSLVAGECWYDELNDVAQEAYYWNADTQKWILYHVFTTS